MDKLDAEKIESIVDEHDLIFRIPNRTYIYSGVVAFIMDISYLFAAFLIYGTHLNIMFTVVASFYAIYLIFVFPLLDTRSVLSHQILLQLMHMVEDIYGCEAGIVSLPVI